jgi:hypothetical protein
MAEAKKQEKKANRLDMFKQAVQLSVEGDEVALTSVKGPDGEEFHVTPRTVSKKDAARIRKLLTQAAVSLSPAVRGRVIRSNASADGELDQKKLMEALSDEDLAAVFSGSDDEAVIEVLRAKLLCGIARQDLSDEPGPMTEEIAELVLTAPAVADEILGLVDALNPPFPGKSSA